MSDIDDILRKRLENLRADGSLTASAPKASTSGILPKPVKKTAAEQVEDLLAQLSDETNIDGKVEKTSIDRDSQLRSRLERLKSREGCEFISSMQSTSKPAEKPEDELADEEFFTRSSCIDLLADLDSASDKDSSLSDDSDVSECLCVMCDDKKPSITCLGCDKDRLCKKCFKEYYADEDGHKTVPYVKKQ